MYLIDRVTQYFYIIIISEDNLKIMTLILLSKKINSGSDIIL